MNESESGAPEVRRDDAGHRYDVFVDGRPVGYLSYREDPGRLAFLHTEVADEMEGRGIGGALVRGALEDAKARSQAVAPLCPFVAAYVKRHREWWDLIPPEFDEAIGRPSNR